MRIFCALILLIGITIHVSGQSCQINSDSTVCKGELISFTPVYTGSASAFFWEFGDNSTNNQKNTSHVYTQTGSMTVKVTITFNDGSTCVATKQIFVHDIPLPSFVLEDAEYCLSIHNICLRDKSSMGKTTTGYSVRTIIWGDGGLSSSTSPYNGEKICYMQYDSAGTYTINIEVQNDKGCEAVWSKDISILKDYTPGFRVIKGAPGCNKQMVCFVNEDSIKPGGINSFTWDFADGDSNTGIWDSLCHVFTEPGMHTVSLTTRMNNGCINTAEQSFNLSFPKVEANVHQHDSVLCYPGAFTFSHQLVAGAFYSWELYDSAMKFIRVVGTGISETFVPPGPGYYHVRLRLSKSGCEDLSPFFKINALGIDASFKAYNNQQCALEDTVYFHNLSRLHPRAIPQYVWSFKDDSTTGPCSTWRNNCNYDTSEHSRHFYLDTGCYHPKLYAYDAYSGCIDSAEGIVNILDPYGAEFKYELELPCTGDKVDYTVRFDHNLCFANIFASYDLCNGQWQKYIPSYLYDTVCNKNGWVSMSFAVHTGDSLVYRSHDPSDYYIDSRKICKDTVSYANWFQLHPQPKPIFEFLRDSCLPDSVRLIYRGEDEGKITLMEYSWGGIGDLEHLEITDTIPDLYYYYREEGEYHTIVQITDSFGCYAAYGHVEKYGYYNQFKYDSIICAGDSIQFKDSVRYWNDIKAYWNNPSNKEQVYWDFDDGRGFATRGNNPVFQFTDRRDYTVRMLTNDKHGCTDTFTGVVHSGGVDAGIRTASRKLLCNQVTQFFDSSFSDFNKFGDSLSYFYWDFGDFTAPSYKEDPFHLYSSGRSFTIKHAISSVFGCSDTAYLQVEIIGPRPEFDIVFDSVGCEPFTVTFKSKSSNVSDFIWSMGDPARTTFTYKTDTSLSFTYKDPGIYYIYLRGADSFYNSGTKNYYTCTAIFPDTVGVMSPILKRVIVLPIPQTSFKHGSPVCLNESVLFSHTGDPRYEYFKWNFGEDTLFTQGDSLVYVFRDTGWVNVGLMPGYVPVGTYERACYDSAFSNVYVSDLEAAFVYEKDEHCSIFLFTDSSRNGVDYSWNFGHPASQDKNNAEGVSAEHDYGRDTGAFKVCLTVTNPHGCKDTACDLVYASYSEFAGLYNVFTPNKDGLNDDFGMNMENADEYQLRIYNRWGELVFVSDNMNERWNGKFMNTGFELPDGEYFYLFRYSFHCSFKEYESHGIVELIR